METMHRVGIPVWYVRHQGTIHECTRIGAIRPCVSASIAFDTSRFVAEGWNTIPTPTWLDAQLFDLSSESILRQYRILSHINKPTLRPTIAAIDAQFQTDDGFDGGVDIDNTLPDEAHDDGDAHRPGNVMAGPSCSHPSDSDSK